MGGLVKAPKVKKDRAAEAANRRAREQAYRDQQDAARRNAEFSSQDMGMRSLLSSNRGSLSGILGGNKSLLGSSPRKRI